MFSCIWQWVYMGFCVNKMVNFNIKILLIISFININAYSQKLFIPLSDPEIISIYKKGEKDEDGSYISRDSLGNIRIKGKFNKLKPVGKWYVFFDNGKLMSNYSYSEEGYLDGTFVEYYSHGKIKVLGKFDKNIQTGIWKTFYFNGEIETEGQMLNGKRYKQWNYFFRSGNIKEISNYNVDGLLNGDLISYDDFGTIVSKASYIKNKIDGEYLEFYYNGRVALRGFYKLGFRDSVWTEFGQNKFGQNRNISFLKRYKDDLPNSKWTYYYPNTNIIKKEESYSNGIKDGFFNEYYYNRKLAKSYYYKNNLQEGEYNEFFPDGTISVKGNFNNGLKDGLWETYREDGTIFSIGNFKNDFQDGSWKFFHRTGNISSEGIYKNGFEIDQWIFYYEEGQLDEIGSYSFGLKNGLWGRFHMDGTLKLEETYNLGRLINVTDYYLSDGSIVNSGSLKDGNGEFLDYYDNGSLFSISNYKDGYLNGVYKEFHLNGKESIVGNYNKNTRVGYWYTFSKRGLEINKEKYD